MKQRFWKILALALLAAVLTAPVQAKKVNPIKDWRRTLFASYGQRALVFEAPVGMCFLDESNYLEGVLLSHIRNFSGAQYQLIGTFGDCLEISKFQRDYQDALLASPQGAGAGVTGSLKKYGSIYWVNPENGDDVISLQRAGYLSAREKTFRDDVIRDIIGERAHGSKTASRQANLSLQSMMARPDEYKFDDAVHSTPDGLSLAYQLDTEIEYQKSHAAGIVSTTLIRHIPLQFSFDFSTGEPDKDNKALYAMMDAFLAQQIKLNAQMANQ
jgi:hypothetical protein